MIVWKSTISRYVKNMPMIMFAKKATVRGVRIGLVILMYRFRIPLYPSEGIRKV